jgi:hypothetical protein
MPAALGARFVLEAGFLILLAVVVGLADLSPALIVLVMTVGWLLVALIEYFAWRQSPGLATARRYSTVEAPPPVTEHEALVEDIAPPPPPPPAPTPSPAEDETIVARPEAEPPPEETEEARDFLAERQIRHRLEPLKPRPKRRWIIFGPYERREDDHEEEQ